nr:ribonuclease H-like domain-containing protein [Tanacetum cinerariifolium]
MITRAKARIFKSLERMNFHVTTTSLLLRSHVHALRDPNWKEAMLDEYNALITNGTWVLVPGPANVNVVRSMWLFKHKFHADGSLSMYKARLVANRHSQQQDNKRPRAMALKAKLRNLKLGDLYIDGYFQKIESIVSVLNGLGSPLSNDDVVTFALEGLPSTYEMISTVIVIQEPFPDLKMYLHNGVHGKSTLLPRTSGSASSVTDVTRSDLDMLQSLLAKFGLNAPNTSTPSPPVAYTVSVPLGFPSYSHRGLVSDGVTAAGGLLSTAGGSDAFWSTAGGSPCTWTFTAANSVYDRGSTAARGSFPGSVHLGQSPSMPFHPS